MVELAGNAGQHAQLATGQFAIGHGHAQHGGVALDVPAVLQAQGAEILIGQGACQVALQLVAVLRRTGVDELPVKFGVLVHRSGSPLGSERYRAMSFMPA